MGNPFSHDGIAKRVVRIVFEIRQKLGARNSKLFSDLRGYELIGIMGGDIIDNCLNIISFIRFNRERIPKLAYIVQDRLQQDPSMER